MPALETDVVLRWADMDSLGHVNNATTLTLLEEGRVRLLHQAGQHIDHEFGLVVARHEIDYLRPMYYSLTPVAMTVWIERIGTASFTFGCTIDQNGATAVSAQTVVVAIATDGSGSTPLPESAREALGRFLRES